MIDELISRVKQMYYQLEQDQQRGDRRAMENAQFGVTAPPTLEDFGAAPVPPQAGPSPPANGAPEPAPPQQPSLLDLWSSRR